LLLMLFVCYLHLTLKLKQEALKWQKTFSLP